MGTCLEAMHLSLYTDYRTHLVLYVLFLLFPEILVHIARSFCPFPRYLSGGLAGENPPVATASTKSRERLAAVKQALRALGFNKQVLIGIAYSFC